MFRTISKMIAFVWISLLWPNLISAVVLPGSCRVFKFSFDLQPDIETYNVVGKVGFSESKSYLFDDEVFEPCIFYIFQSEFYLYDLLSFNAMCPSVKGEFYMERNGMVVANMSLAEAIRRERISPVVEERFQAWYVNGVLVLWSCRNISGTPNHDEAMLVLSNETHRRWSDDALQWIRKQFSKKLLEKMNWENETGLFCATRKECKSPLTIDLITESNDGVAYYLVAIFLVLLIMGMCYFLFGMNL